MNLKTVSRRNENFIEHLLPAPFFKPLAILMIEPQVKYVLKAKLM